MFKIKKSLLCISAISCMSLYASTIAVPIKVNNPITIGSSTKDTKVATDLTNTDYNYWSTTENKTYVFNTSSSNTCWRANNTVTIDNGYTLKLITNHTNGYYYVLYCYNTFTNNGNVIIDKYGVLDLNIKTSNNNGTIDINNGLLTLMQSAKLNNKGTITLKDSSFIDIYSSNTLTNTGTIDISNITDLSNWYNDNIFTLEGGSTFILPKSILGDRKKIGYFYRFKPITLSGTKDKPVNIVIPKDCEYITYIDNNNKEDLFELIKEATWFTKVLFNAIEEATGFTFKGNKDNVKFSWQTSLDNECEYVDEC